MYENRDRFSGYWRQGLKEGTGIYIFNKDNTRLKGTWRGGEFVEGDWQLENGATFNGRFENGKPLGEGKWTIGGKTLAGEYS